ncbi:MAG TPA: hypothetical protein VGK54_15180, partial [Chloroflexota bacterium]
MLKPLALGLLLVLTLGCGSGAGQTSPGGGSGSAPAPSGPKSITIVLPIDVTSLGGSLQGLGAAAVPTRYFKEFPNAYLTTLDQQDENVPWMATQVPSLDDGTWKVREDGKMDVTWKLRPGIH